MTVLFLANVGSSDLKLDDGKRITPPRSAGKELLARWDEPDTDLPEHLQLPILAPSLREVLATHERIERVVLFATDQADPRYRATDTLYFAELARLWLRDAPDFADVLGDIKVDRLDSASPATYDSTFAVYVSRIASLDDDEIAVCYVGVTGGTPAMNMALLFHAVRVFGSRCQAVYKRPDPDEPAFPLDIGTQLRQSVSRQAVVAALARRDFAAALALMEETGGYDDDLVALTRYAKQRLNFDFDSARRSLSHAIASGYRRPALRCLATTAIRDLDKLRARDLEARLTELTHNAAIAYQAQRYVSFLGRIYRFQEAVLRWIMENICDLPTDMSPEHREETSWEWKQRIEAHSKLHAFLQEQTIGDKALDYEQISRPTMKAIVRFVRDQNEKADGTPYLDKRSLGLFYGGFEKFTAFNQLADLRNRTIIAHGFQGVSAAILDAKYDGDPMAGLYDVLTKFGVLVGPNPPCSPDLVDR
jgi:hypothetical protein